MNNQLSTCCICVGFCKTSTKYKEWTCQLGQITDFSIGKMAGSRILDTPQSTDFYKIILVRNRVFESCETDKDRPKIFLWSVCQTAFIQSFSQSSIFSLVQSHKAQKRTQSLPKNSDSLSFVYFVRL